jgi:hypothetical protein
MSSASPLHLNEPTSIAATFAAGQCRSGCEQMQQVHRYYSITSLARPDSGSGTVMPSALAVLRLMISSTFVDCTTGRSAGFSPLRMRPV